MGLTNFSFEGATSRFLHSFACALGVLDIVALYSWSGGRVGSTDPSPTPPSRRVAGTQKKKNRMELRNNRNKNKETPSPSFPGWQATCVTSWAV